jgi:hypothetical protein
VNYNDGVSCAPPPLLAGDVYSCGLAERPLVELLIGVFMPRLCWYEVVAFK